MLFLAIITTVCRALGLPTRSVTNFSSAHDTDESCTIDTFWNEDGEKDEWRTSDSVWLEVLINANALQSLSMALPFQYHSYYTKVIGLEDCD